MRSSNKIQNVMARLTKTMRIRDEIIRTSTINDRSNKVIITKTRKWLAKRNIEEKTRISITNMGTVISKDMVVVIRIRARIKIINTSPRTRTIKGTRIIMIRIKDIQIIIVLINNNLRIMTIDEIRIKISIIGEIIMMLALRIMLTTSISDEIQIQMVTDRCKIMDKCKIKCQIEIVMEDKIKIITMQMVKITEAVITLVKITVVKIMRKIMTMAVVVGSKMICDLGLRLRLSR